MLRKLSRLIGTRTGPLVTVAFAAGCLTLGTLALLLSRSSLTEALLTPLLIGAAGSLIATLVTQLLTLAALGRDRLVEVLWTRQEVYTEAERLVREVSDIVRTQKAISRNLQVTTLSRRESPDGIPEVDTYMEAIGELLEAVAANGGNVYYKVLGKFGDYVNDDYGQRRLVLHQNEVEDRLKKFSEKARSKVRIASFEEIWPVDLLVIRGKIIIGFRGHSDGELRWGVRISSGELANRAEAWLEELWNDDKATRVWDGLKVLGQ